jgi:glycolate dehydrogenase FAD-binding subunit
VTAITERIEEVQRVVQQTPPDLRILPVAGGSKPALSTPFDDRVMSLDVSGLSGMVEYDPNELTFTALASTPIAEVSQTLAQHDQYLPFDPPFAGAKATLGGTVAAGASGANAFRHGGVRDFIVGVRFVDGTGRVVAGGGRVVKNAAGFDLPKLMVGSMGRLGVMVELSFKVFPRPRATVTLGFELRSHVAALPVIARLARGPIDLDAVDLEPTGRLLVRLGGDPRSLDARVTRLATEVGVDSQRHDGEADATLWREAADLTWALSGTVIVRVGLTARSVAALQRALAPFGAQVRYSLAVNVAWIAWPGEIPLDELGSALLGLGLTGMALIGPPSPRLLGVAPGGAFAARIRSALDPFARFPDS